MKIGRALVTSCVSILAALVAAGAPTGPAPKASAPPSEWPREVHLAQADLLVDAPQAESLDGNTLKAKGTLTVRRLGKGQSSFGTAWYEADVEVDRDGRVVHCTAVRVTRVRMSPSKPEQEQRLGTRLALELTRWHLHLPLDDVLAQAKAATRRDETPPKLGTDPPAILFETEPAVLVVFDGEARFRALENTKLERALNTPFLVVKDTADGAYYLDGGTSWFRAADWKGPWSKADDAPSDAVQLARRDLKDAGVDDKEVGEASRSADDRVPKILVATQPSELIVSDGPPQWKPLVAGELEYLSTTESDVLRTLPDQHAWVVLSGRWYEGSALTGPWTYVEPDRLPSSFRSIPQDSVKSAVLSFVPGTALAREALRDAGTPRTAAIRRSEAHVTVTYDGEPRFEAVPGTKVEYAVNTEQQVLRIRGRFYVCDQGVWFAAGSPEGPWVVAGAIPDDDIRSIPPESPVYNTRYAYVYDATPDIVYVAYTPAYVGSYAYYGSVVFGTGFFYRPWWGTSYYPRPFTWGFGAFYRPWAGWGYGFSWGPAWRGFRFGFGYGWGARWCGPGGFYRPYAFARNVNITRSVNVTRNVTRNVYTNGANRSRAITTQAAASRANASPRTAAAAPRAGQGARTGARPQPGGAKKGASAHPPKAKAGGAKGGGRKKA